MRITPAYQTLQAEFHRLKPTYGAGGGVYAQHIASLAERFNVGSILDYSAGKRGLQTAMRDPRMREYDPCVPEIAREPEPADLVVCLDALEHIEPECLEDVLDHLWTLTRVACFVAVQCAPATKTLPDGRNAHLIQQPPPWWMERFAEAGFAVSDYYEAPDGKAFSALLRGAA